MSSCGTIRALPRGEIQPDLLFVVCLAVFLRRERGRSDHVSLDCMLGCLSRVFSRCLLNTRWAQKRQRWSVAGSATAQSISSDFTMAANRMQSVENSTHPKTHKCESCEMRREKLAALGVAIYFPSLFTCGLMLPFSLIAAIVIQALLLRKCKDCRARAKLGAPRNEDG